MAVNDVIVPQADAVSGATIYASAATTTSGSAGPFPVDFFSSAEVSVVVSSCSGTLDVYVQKLLPDGATYDDLAHYGQFTTTSSTVTKTLSYVNGGNLLNTQGSAALATNTLITAAFGSYWRALWVIAGTGATATFGIYGDFRA